MAKTSLLMMNNNIDLLKYQLLNILNINETNNSFNLHEIDTNKEIQNKILDLETFCKNSFSVSTWTYFKNKKNNKLNDRSYLTLIRNILNICNIKYVNKQTSTIIDNKVIYYTKYILV